MSRYFSFPLIILGIALIIGGFIVPLVLRNYSQNFARMAVKNAREPERFDSPKAQDAAINHALESSNRLQDIMANAAIVLGVISGGVLIFSAHFFNRTMDLNARLNDAKETLEVEIERRYDISKQGEQVAATDKGVHHNFNLTDDDDLARRQL